MATEAPALGTPGGVKLAIPMASAQVFSLAAGLFDGDAGEAAGAASGPVPNPLLALGRGASRALRSMILSSSPRSSQTPRQVAQ